MVATKSEEVTKQGFCKILWRKLRLREGLLLSFIGLCVRGSSGGGGRLFEAGRLLTFSASRLGAYSRRALIRGWALIRINTVKTSKIVDVVGTVTSTCDWDRSKDYISAIRGVRLTWCELIPSVYSLEVAFSKKMTLPFHFKERFPNFSHKW